MPSHLTRQIFRRLLANEPIVYRGCLRRPTHRAYGSITHPPRQPRQWRQIGGDNRRALMSYEQTRSFLNFNFFQKNERIEKEASMDPGLEKMMELAKRERMRARMPPVEDVEKALRAFFASKIKGKSRITDNQAQLVTQSLQYYLAEVTKAQGEDAQQLRGLPSGDVINDLPQADVLRKAGDALHPLPDELAPSHVQFSKLLYDTLRSLGYVKSNKAFVKYVKALTRQGKTSDAERLVLEYEQAVRKVDQSTAGSPGGNSLPGVSKMAEDNAAEEDQDDTSVVKGERAGSRIMKAWISILQGYALEQDVTGLERALSATRERGLEDSFSRSLIMVGFCIGRNDIAGARQWWELYRNSDRNDSPAALEKAVDVLRAMLMWCLDHNELATGHEVVKDLMNHNPRKEFWDSVFIWAAGTGNGVDEIGRMMNVMEKSNQSIADESEWRIVDIETINALVEFAVRRKDPYMAERFITLGQSRNVEPNARTYVLQMEYRLSVDDVDGALIAYKGLQSMDTSSNEDLPTVNNLIVALCKTQRHDFDTIMNVAADLSDRRATFTAETVAALSLIHLNRDELHDVLDLLNTHAYHYSTLGRELVRDSMLKTALDPKTPTARAWNSYLLTHDFFDETPRPLRTSLMEAFIARERSDMSVRIFQQMRAHSRPDTIPTIDTYVAAFLALAKIRDLNALEIVHNQLKLDYNVVATTYCYNALMLAYVACDDAEVGLRFWANIVASKEGPSYNSIHIALRACEKTPFGDIKARDIWSLLRRRNVDLDHSLWCSYLASLAGMGNIDQALNAVEEAEEKDGVVVDEFLLGSLCDATPTYGEKQAMIEEWAQDRYPEVFKKLVEVVGYEEVKGGSRKFKVDRRVSP